MLNLELKSSPSVAALAELDSQISRIIGNRYYYSSTDIETLTKLRSVNESVYLGLILWPHSESIRLLRQELKLTSGQSEELRKYNGYLQKLGEVGQRIYDSQNRDWTTQRQLFALQNKLGPNAGIHLDIRDFSETRSLTRNAEIKGLKIHTYSINGKKFHVDSLVQLAMRLRVPDAIIVDASPYYVCQRLFGVSRPKGLHRPTFSVSRIVSELPWDADMQRLNEQISYHSNGLYLALSGEVANLADDTPRSTKTESQTLPSLPTDENIELENGEAIRISIERD